jgi:hypothetical protein
MRVVLLTHVEMVLASSLAEEGFGQHTLRYILCPRWLGIALVNTCWDKFPVLVGMGRGLFNRS